MHGSDVYGEVLHLSFCRWWKDLRGSFPWEKVSVACPVSLCQGHGDPSSVVPAVPATHSSQVVSI